MLGLGKQTAIRSLDHRWKFWNLDIWSKSPEISLITSARPRFFWLAAQSNSLKGVTETPTTVNYSAVRGRSRKKGLFGGKVGPWSGGQIAKQKLDVEKSVSPESGPIVFQCISNLYQKPCYDTSELLAYSILMYNTTGMLFPELRSLGCVCWLFLANAEVIGLQYASGIVVY